MFCKALPEIEDYSVVSSCPISAFALFLLENIDIKSKVIIIPDVEIAEKLLRTLVSFKPDIKNRVYLFSEWDSRIDDHVSPSLQVQADRLAVLFKLMNENEPITVISTLQSLSQYLPPMDYITEYSILIKEGEELEQNELALKLVGSGYQRVDIVEEAGTFSIRGNIIDIFSASNKVPIRIELFGDIIESIKQFDSDTQRSIQKIEKTFITPAREISFSEQALSCFKDKFKNYCDDHNIRKDTRSKFTELVENGFYFPGIEYYLPFFFNEFASFFDYLPKDIQLLTYDDCLFAIDMQKKEYHEDDDPDFPAYPLEKLYLDKKIITDFLLKSNKYFYSMDLYDENRKTISLKEHFISQKRINAESKDALDVLEIYISDIRNKKMSSVFVCHTNAQAERLSFILKKFNEQTEIDIQTSIYEFVCNPVKQKSIIVLSPLSEGVQLVKTGISIITEDEIFGEKTKNTNTKVVQDTFFNIFRELKEKDYVVHSKHGVGIYKGLKKMSLDNVENDFFQIEYSGGDILYVPVYRLNTVQKFIGKEGSGAKLDKLGGASWEKKRSKAKKATMDIAQHLLKLQAERNLKQGFVFAPNDEMYYKFEAEFEFEETPDQYKAIKDVIEDMEKGKSMDRLICGDVGYGKTEVALRAAFKAVANNKQVAILVPTTILAFQHYQLFRRRFSNYPVNVEMLSRFKSRKEQIEIIKKLKDHQVDIVIGTHRLLSVDVNFSDLGLLVIDEEQRFGVKHKERIKEFSADLDILTMTATPIPRTLNMSLIGLKEISVITTAPINRLPIKTYIARYSKKLLRNAIMFEIKRGGQVFFLHNRVADLAELYNELNEIVPEAKIIAAHGQMDEKDLEEKMLEFYNKKADILLCTAIIESGLDIPNCNTIIVNRADMFGLSQLYQIRGRVGRSTKRAYCYLLLPSYFDISKDAMERLKALQQFTELGSGFNIASYDLELRGAGELLGSSQSGFIDDIGFEEYLNMLEDAVNEIKGNQNKKDIEPEISINMPAFIPESYITNTTQRLYFYKKLSSITAADQLVTIEEELIDRYGVVPEEIRNLFKIITIKQYIKPLDIISIKIGNNRLVYAFDNTTKILPEKIVGLVTQRADKYKITPDMKLISNLDDINWRNVIKEVEDFILLITRKD